MSGMGVAMNDRPRDRHARCDARRPPMVFSLELEEARLAAVAGRASALPDVGAVCAILVRALSAPQNINELIIVCAGEIGLSQNRLVVATDKAGDGRSAVPAGHSSLLAGA